MLVKIQDAAGHLGVNKLTLVASPNGDGGSQSSGDGGQNLYKQQRRRRRFLLSGLFLTSAVGHLGVNKLTPVSF
jgi:hypothetical protein